VPRIDAPTVAEHHAKRRAALLEAAEQVLADLGLDALSLGAVGAEAGLARSSVYQYFDSTPALLVAVVEDAFPRATQRLRDAVDAQNDPRAKVDAYVGTALELATDRTHRSLAALAGADLPAECRARVAELHSEQDAPLRDALRELGDRTPDLTARLMVALVRGAAQAVAEGASLTTVRRRTLALVHEGIG
jgi:AcrR family transcriptional regulator